MCSIFGYYKLKKNAIAKRDFVHQAKDFMRHRGPDAENFYEVGRAGLGHQRLSIIDVSASANQPMNFNGKHISFNGEIYNYLELKRAMLPNRTFRTTSDTEVLLSLMEVNGSAALKKLNGMFAFAYYDSTTEVMHLCRDRFGVKPLYYTVENDILYFSSEIRPLTLTKKTCRRNLRIYSEFLEHVATDFNHETHIEGIYQIEPGHYLEIIDGVVRPINWYYGSDFDVDISAFRSQDSTCEYVEDLLVNSIALRLRSDVPVSITLSGGLDSSLIYTLIKERLKQNIEVYHFSHPGKPTDESHRVKALLSKYGDSLVEIATSSDHRFDDWERVIGALEFASWSFSALAFADVYREIGRHNCKVVIEGHGSDEQLGGYSYMVQQATVSYAMQRKYIKSWEAYRTYSAMLQHEQPHIIKQANGVLSLIKFIYFILSAHHRGFEGFDVTMNKAFNFKILPIVLRTFDRLSMMYSVESRAPFMDFRLVETFAKMPIEYKVASIGSKAILRMILKKYKKDFIYENKQKLGFASDEIVFLNNQENKSKLKEQIVSLAVPELDSLRREALVFLNDTIDWQHTFTLSKASSLAIVENIYNFANH